MATPESLYLHIGAHKTASTLLQKALSEDKQLLSRNGIALVRRSRLEASDFQKTLNRVARTGKRPSRDDEERAADSFRRLVSVDADIALLTNEGMFERVANPRFYRHIKEALSWVSDIVANPIRVIFFTRSQPDYLQSMYMQKIHAGGAQTFEEFLNGYHDIELSWTRVLDDIGAAIGPQNVTALPYESIKRVGSNGYYRNFLASIGVGYTKLDVDQAVSKSAANRSYSEEALRLARVVNPLIVGQKNRSVLRRYLQENYSIVTHSRPALFSDTDRNELLGELVQENQRLFDTYLRDWNEDRPAYFNGH